MYAQYSKYNKDFIGLEIEAHKEALDGWNEVELTNPDAVLFSEPEVSFCVYSRGTEFDIQEILKLCLSKLLLKNAACIISVAAESLKSRRTTHLKNKVIYN